MVREAPGPPLPGGPSLPPRDDRLDGGPRRGLGRGRERLLPDVLRAEQRGPLGRRRRRPGRHPALGGALLRRDPGQPGDPAARRPVASADARRRAPRDRLRSRSRCPASTSAFRAPAFGDPRLDALDIASQVLSGGKGSRLHKRLVREERIAQDVALVALGFVGGASICAGWATVRPGVSVERVEAALHEELDTARPRADQRRRAGPRPGPDRDRGARRPLAGRGAGGPPLDVRDAVRRPGPDQSDAAALSLGHRGPDPPGRERGVPAGEPRRPDLPARAAAGRAASVDDESETTEGADEEVAA